jgi:hypothetical protein
MNELAGLHGVPDNRAAYTSPLQGDRLRDCHSGCPCENSCRKRDRIAVLRLVIVNKLNTRRCPIGVVNRGPAARGGKTAENNNKETDSRHLHDCDPSILAMRRLCSYQKQLAWQVFIYLFFVAFLFSVQAVCFAGTRQ